MKKIIKFILKIYFNVISSPTERQCRAGEARNLAFQFENKNEIPRRYAPRNDNDSRFLKWLGIIIAFIIFHAAANAQWETETTLHTSIDDNVSNNYEQLNDKITRLNLGTGYIFDDSDWNTQLFYQGSYNYYSTLTDRIYYFHSAGIATTYLGETHEFDLGATYSTRLNRSAYSFLGYNEFNVYVTHKAEPVEGFISTFGYRANYTAFDELSDLDNLENVLFGNITHSFETKTTLIAGGDIGAKWYSPVSTSSSVSQSRGNGSIMKSVGTVTSQATAFIKIGQSLFEKTGLSGYARYQLNILNNARSLLNIYSVTDDEIFDTRYGYEGLYYELSLKQLFPYAIAAEIGYGVAEKNYINSAAYDLIGNILSSERNDMRYIFSAELKKGFDISEGNTLVMSLQYDSIVNDSNDPYFNYHNSVVAFQLGFSF